MRECNPETFSVKELVPSEGNVFEEYSFFAISIQKMQMAYLSDPAVSTNIPGLVLTLLRPSVNIKFNLEESSLYDYDIKKKIKQLGNKVAVYGIMQQVRKEGSYLILIHRFCRIAEMTFMLIMLPMFFMDNESDVLNFLVISAYIAALLFTVWSMYLMGRILILSEKHSNN